MRTLTFNEMYERLMEFRKFQCGCNMSFNTFVDCNKDTLATMSTLYFRFKHNKTCPICLKIRRGEKLSSTELEEIQKEYLETLNKFKNKGEIL